MLKTYKCRDTLTFLGLLSNEFLKIPPLPQTAQLARCYGLHLAPGTGTPAHATPTHPLDTHSRRLDTGTYSSTYSRVGTVHVCHV